MDRATQKKIRRVYYIGAVLIILVMVITLSIPYFINLRKEYEEKVEQLTSSIIEQKKIYIKSIILEKFSDLRDIEEILLKKENEKALILLHSLERILINESYQDRIMDINNLNLGFPLDSEHYIITDQLSGKILYSTAITGEEDSGDYPVYQSKLVKQKYRVDVFLTEQEFIDLFQKRAIDSIRNAHLPENEYIWVNHILNYEGGEDYAIRLVHPNMPETEGMLLSTSMEDIKGNKPYEKELDGVKKEGETFFDYYFKKMEDNEIAHKLTYARLYEEFDWVIATGVYLDDVDLLIKEEKRLMESTFKKRIQFIILFTLLVIIISLFLIVRFERFLNKLINDYTQKLDQALVQIKEIAYKDPLTNLLNRRAMYDRLSEEVSRHSRMGESFCVVMGDIDFFKKVNDSYGHAVGDIILIDIAALLVENIRKMDCVSRWGGEEFLILFSNTPLSSGALTAEKLRKQISETLFTPPGYSINLTMTFGVAQFHEGEDLEDVIQRADKKLYEGKESGRNRVVS